MNKKVDVKKTYFIILANWIVYLLYNHINLSEVVRLLPDVSYVLGSTPTCLIFERYLLMIQLMMVRQTSCTHMKGFDPHKRLLCRPLWGLSCERPAKSDTLCGSVKIIYVVA